MVVKVYISGISGNKEVKKKQQRVQMILDSKSIEYETIDITEPGREKDKEFMQANGQVRENLGKHPLPPQIFNDEQFCGDYESFDLANEVDELEKFLHLPITAKSSGDSSAKLNGSTREDPTTNNGTTDTTKVNGHQDEPVEVTSSTTLNENPVSSSDEINDDQLPDIAHPPISDEVSEIVVNNEQNNGSEAQTSGEILPEIESQAIPEKDEISHVESSAEKSEEAENLNELAKPESVTSSLVENLNNNFNFGENISSTSAFSGVKESFGTSQYESGTTVKTESVLSDSLKGKDPEHILLFKKQKQAALTPETACEESEKETIPCGEIEPEEQLKIKVLTTEERNSVLKENFETSSENIPVAEFKAESTEEFSIIKQLPKEQSLECSPLKTEPFLLNLTESKEHATIKELKMEEAPDKSPILQFNVKSDAERAIIKELRNEASRLSRECSPVVEFKAKSEQERQIIRLLRESTPKLSRESSPVVLISGSIQNLKSREGTPAFDETISGSKKCQGVAKCNEININRGPSPSPAVIITPHEMKVEEYIPENKSYEEKKISKHSDHIKKEEEEPLSAISESTKILHEEEKCARQNPTISNLEKAVAKELNLQESDILLAKPRASVNLQMAPLVLPKTSDDSAKQKHSFTEARNEESEGHVAELLEELRQLRLVHDSLDTRNKLLFNDNVEMEKSHAKVKETCEQLGRRVQELEAELQKKHQENLINLQNLKPAPQTQPEDHSNVFLITEYEDQIKSIKDQHSETLNKCKHLEITKKELEKKCLELNAHANYIEEKKKAVEEQMRELKKDHDILWDRLTDTDIKFKKLHAMHTDLDSHRNELLERCQALMAKSDELIARNEEITNKRNNLLERNAILERDLIDLKKVYETNKTKLTRVSETLEEVNQLNEHLKQTNESLNKTTDDLLIKNNDLRRMNADLEERKEEIRKSRDGLKRENDNLKQQLGQAVAKVNQLLKLRDDLQARNQSITETCNELHVRNLDLNKQIQFLQQSQEELVQCCEQLKITNREQQKILEGIQERIDTLIKERDEYQRKNDDLLKSNETLNLTIDDLNRLIDGYRLRINELKMNLEAAAAQIKEIKELNIDLRKLNYNLINENKELKEVVTEEKTRCKNLQQVVEENQKKLHELHETNHELHETNHDLHLKNHQLCVRNHELFVEIEKIEAFHHQRGHLTDLELAVMKELKIRPVHQNN